ncbi:MAG: hypothetical protein ACO3NL_00065 [Phycisphaerales bacterium]|jgi:hypothetical protein
MRFEKRSYPAPGDKRPKKATVESMTASDKGFAQAKSVKIGEYSEEGVQKKVKGAGAATKGTSFTSYIN